MNIWASSPRRFLAWVILDGQFKRDRTSERHSSKITSIEQILAEDSVSKDYSEITQDRINEGQLNDTGSHFSSAHVAKANNCGMRKPQLAESGGAWSRLYAHLREGYDGQEQGCGGGLSTANTVLETTAHR